MRVSCALDRVAVKVGQLDAGQRQDRHVAVGQKIDVARVVQDAGHVGGDKRLAFAHADDHRRANARGDNLVRLGGRKHAQRKGAGEALHRAAHGLFQRNRLARCFRVFLHLLNQVGNDLRVGLGDKLVALRDEFALQVEIILHNAVVDHHDAAGAVAVRMRILLRGRPCVAQRVWPMP